jgi:hypothetical protein
MLRVFNLYIGGATRCLEARNIHADPANIRFAIEQAEICMRQALRIANLMDDVARKALCLRVMNWLRADLRRAA